MIDFVNKVYIGSEGRKSLFDCQIPENPKAVVIFVHGYKGYKDWGAWNLMQKAFVDDGYGFVKFNMSHNGGTIEEPIDFPDLEAFGRNTYSFEINDLETIISETERMIHQELALDIPIYLLGHSRGGGIVLLEGAGDARIKKVISLAGISDIAMRFPGSDELEEWEEQGVRFVTNGRTGQEMPHYYSFYEDYAEHQVELDIELACRSLSVPFLQVHGDMDEAVSISEGLSVAIWTDTEVKIIKGAGHTFGASQPWDSDKMPEDLELAVRACIDFFNS
jgi:pimeloyl-ACP methyl ester carboxylesterase